jgi:tRNA 2-thiouridine synthesizing protein A
MIDAMDVRQIDARGLYCPIPVLRLATALSQLPDGARVDLIATDPAAVGDVEAFCSTGIASLIEQSELSGVFRFQVEKRSRPSPFAVRLSP